MTEAGFKKEDLTKEGSENPGGFNEKVAGMVPLPMCIVNRKGKIVEGNELLGRVFVYDDLKDYDFFALTNIRMETLISAAENAAEPMIERNDKLFRIAASCDMADENSDIYVFFRDVTEFEEIKKKYEKERLCVARVDVDNYDDFMATTDPEDRGTIISNVDKIIRRWAFEIGGTIEELDDRKYVIYFQESAIDPLLRNKFSILDEVRAVETTADFPMSLSIGLGLNGKNIVETKEFANMALDLALGRGGDQAVVRDGSKIDYYGGKLQSVEKGNKGKSRVIEHALKRLIKKAERVVIMGHKSPDMDAFGASLGMYRVCKIYDKNASIVVNEVSDSLTTIYKKAKATEKYNIIDNKKAMELVDKDTLLIVLDTHRPSYVQCRELLDQTNHVVVIDHHRRAADGIKDAELSYIESYASSASELVTEILQYTGKKKVLEKLEAEALLAGMFVDTNRFAIKTGVRTFEAAAWLRRAGADTAEVKKLFQSNLSDFKARAKAVASAVIGENGIATSICEGFNHDAQIINSQVADELLNIRGVKASFVAGRDDTGRTVVSARSLGDVNVQLVMEKMGGGGHLTTAGAQVDESPDEIIEMITSVLLNSERSDRDREEGE